MVERKCIWIRSGCVTNTVLGGGGGGGGGGLSYT